MNINVSRAGKRESVVIPAGLRPIAVLATESYTPERKAEFLLSNAIDASDYAEAVKTVKDMGLDPAKIKPHGFISSLTS
jgi:hypothetical protein